MFDFMDCVLHYKADTQGAALTGGGVRDSPGMCGVKEDTACEAFLVHVPNFPEVLWGWGRGGGSAYLSTNYCHVAAPVFVN